MTKEVIEKLRCKKKVGWWPREEKGKRGSAFEARWPEIVCHEA